MKRKGTFYEIKWKGFSNKYNTWESINNLEDVMEFVEEYEDKIAKPNPIAPPFIIKVI